MNQVGLNENLSADVEVRYTPAGDAVADLRMAVNERYRNARTSSRRRPTG